jgi:uncharacterized FAD-dependent dehydrogenase
MKKELNIVVTPAQAHDLLMLKRIVSENLKIDIARIQQLVVIRRSIDARNSNVRFNLGLNVFIDEAPQIEKAHYSYPDISTKPQVVIVGAGPAGLFAALHLIEPMVFP